jgi:hypothetical protein
MRYLVRGGLSCALERACLGRFVDFDLRLAPQHLRNGVWSPGPAPKYFRPKSRFGNTDEEARAGGPISCIA